MTPGCIANAPAPLPVYNSGTSVSYCGNWGNPSVSYQASGCTVTGSNVSATITNNDGVNFTLSLTADPSAIPGQRTVTCNFSGSDGGHGAVSWPIMVYDATPQITSITHFYAPGGPVFVQGEGSVAVRITGNNLGTGGTICGGGSCGRGVTWTGPNTNWSPTEIDTVFRIDQTAIGTYTISVNATADDTGNNFQAQGTRQSQTTGTGTLQAIAIRVQSFRFTNSVAYYRDCAGNASPISQPSWPATAGLACPQIGYSGDHALYVSGAIMQGTVAFSVTPAPTQAVSSVYVQGATSGVGTFTAPASPFRRAQPLFRLMSSSTRRLCLG
jgi:hypothetical protein